MATQPPRNSTSLPTLQLTTSPVSTQPRTSSLEDHESSKEVQVNGKIFNIAVFFLVFNCKFLANLELFVIWMIKSNRHYNAFFL